MRPRIAVTTASACAARARRENEQSLAASHSDAARLCLRSSALDHCEVTVAQPAAGIAKENILPPAETIAVFAAPELYSTVTTFPSGFLNANASPPVVA